jgi:hypothetical protein
MLKSVKISSINQSGNLSISVVTNLGFTDLNLPGFENLEGLTAKRKKKQLATFTVTNCRFER